MSLALGVSLGATAWAGDRWDLDRRVEGAQALERVLYARREWPTANPGPKPEFSVAVPRSALEARVLRALRADAALERYWHRGLTGAQLQAELDRMAAGSRDPELLSALFAALGDDPATAVECLARPALAERLAGSWYARDARFHTEARAMAEERAAGRGACPARRVYARGDDDGGLTPEWGGEVALPADAFDRWLAQVPPAGAPPEVVETDTAFLVVRTLSAGPDRIEAEVEEVPKRPFEAWLVEAVPEAPAPAGPGGVFTLPVPGGARVPEAVCTDYWTRSSLGDGPDTRCRHLSLWTGSELLVWGGQLSITSVGLAANWGARYSPATDTWSTVPPAPVSGRYYPVGVWTGTEMVVFGGQVSTTFYNDGARYDLAADTWTLLPTADAPSARSLGTAVWTGTEMIVWGGLAGGTTTNTGARYAPASNTWTATSTGTNCPTGRQEFTSVWTGSVMIVWGGKASNGAHYNTGGRYNPADNTWLTTSTSSPVPLARRLHTAVWTGAEMVVWGGSNSANSFYQDGGRYSPSLNTWTALPSTGAPTNRIQHTAVWTGSEMIIWGGKTRFSPLQCTNTGGRWSLSSNTWNSLTTTNAPAERCEHGAVWTGTEMVVFGGYYALSLNTGGRYSPTTDSWVPTPIAPAARMAHTALWTGAEMILWGGNTGTASLSSGARYTPATDTWAATSTGAPCPTSRYDHTAVWTGSEMVVWGGQGSGLFADGGKYSLSGDSWAAVSTTGAPGPRFDHTAVWSGSAMVVAGGYDGFSSVATAFLYTPAGDTWAAAGSDPQGSRSGHVAAWTGSEMLLWGGGASPSGYDPSGSGTWRALSTSGAPPSAANSAGVWTGSRFIVWGGGSSTYTQEGGLYDPAGDAWTSTPVDASTPSARRYATAVWTGAEMVVWGGDAGTQTNTGGRYTPGGGWVATSTGAGCPVARTQHTAVWTGSQMIVSGGHEYGTTAVGVVGNGGAWVPGVPAIRGEHQNACPAMTVALAVDDGFGSYQWYRDGSPLGGATAASYTATASGSYTVAVVGPGGCTATSPAHVVTLTGCGAPEVSPAGSAHPARLVADAGSSTGYYLTFEAVAGATAFHLYEGTMGSWYSHGSAPGNVCGLTAQDQGNGEMRAEVTPSAGDHYYLVTAEDSVSEGPSGFATGGVEIDPAQSTCPL